MNKIVPYTRRSSKKSLPRPCKRYNKRIPDPTRYQKICRSCWTQGTTKKRNPSNFRMKWGISKAHPKKEGESG